MRQTLLSGVAAGIAGALLLHLYLIVTVVLIRHQTDSATIMKFVASGFMGKHDAYQNPAAPLVGALVYYSIAIVWGLGYAYASASVDSIKARPLLSGAAFGLVVFVTMQIVEMTVNIWSFNPPNVLGSLIGHVVFFGIPLGFIVSRWPYRV